MYILCLALLEFFCVSSFLGLTATSHVRPYGNIKTNAADSPVLLAHDCYMLEELVIDVNNSHCIFQVHSSNRNLGTLNFTITGSSGEENIFDLQYEKTPSNADTTSVIYLVLKNNQKLSYEAHRLYNFDVQIEGGQKTSVRVYVYKRPTWTQFPSILHIQEELNTYTNITISAKQGGGYPTAEVVVAFESSECEVITRTADGTLQIAIPTIDREILNNFTINVYAYYKDVVYAQTKGTIIVLVTDVDDNPPVIVLSSNETLQITVPQNSTHIYVTHIQISDKDQGANAEFSITAKVPTNFISAITVSPTRGVGNATAEIIIDPKMFNYDDSIWSTFAIELHVRGVKNETAEDTLAMRVTLYKQEISGGAGMVSASTIFLSTLLVIHLNYFFG